MMYSDYVGIFDSGVGGVSVLREIVKVLPRENILYFGDAKNAPYGDRPQEEIAQISLANADYLFNKGVKALVIACNTATSSAADIIREKYPDKIVIGIEPAIKPAVEEHPGENILVMATTGTLKLGKFQQRMNELRDQANLISIPCPGLMDLIEQEDLQNPEIMDLLEKYIGEYRGQTRAVVMGCTHYPFVEPQIRSILGDIDVYNGASGEARELAHQLEERGLLSASENPDIIFESSDGRTETTDFYRRMLNIWLLLAKNRRKFGVLR